MRSLAFTALLGSFIATTSLVGQSLTEHAAAAAGATIGTAAGKPLGTALGNVFGGVDKSASKAANPKAATSKTANAPVTKPVATPEAAAPAATIVLAPNGVGSSDAVAAAGGSGGSSHHSARRRASSTEPELPAAAPIAPIPDTPLVAVPVIKEPTAQDVASIKVGATDREMREALGAPESKVSIPGDDGHLLETCQYWAKGEQIGTIRLDNGRVVSVQTSN